uniref:Protein QUIRKY-like n=1 Tax=Tanacetum cinerariifolium TaxID=118510 RepID=A0A699GXD3_TANCI|nr:protein QUIRKY-like [Tanacetum cinerariifolium]
MECNSDLEWYDKDSLLLGEKLDGLSTAAEPFEEPSILSVEYRVGPNKDDILGRCKLPLQYVERRHNCLTPMKPNDVLIVLFGLTLPPLCLCVVLAKGEYTPVKLCVIQS